MGDNSEIAVNQMHQVSIIIPVYNRAELIKETLASIEQQSYPYWEAIVVDDGSTDNTREVVERMSNNEPRIRLITRQRAPKGAPTCRNIGLEVSKADFVMFLDSDDLLGYYCLEQRVFSIAKIDDKDFWVFPMLLFNENIDDTKIYTNLSNRENDLFRFLRSDLPWSISCVLWKKSFLKSLNGFDESFPNCQDHDLHLRALWKTKNYHVFSEAIPDNFYRQHQGEKIYDPSDKKRVLVGARMLMRRHADMIYSHKDSPDLNKYIVNISIYFKYLIKQHLFINDFQNALELKRYLEEKSIIKSIWAWLFNFYILSAKWGLNRMKGFYRLWDIIFYKFHPNSSWGKIHFKGKLHYSSGEKLVKS